MKTVRSTLDRTCREQAGIWREPTAQATLVAIILIAQVGFRTGFAGDGAFNHRNLQENLSIYINTMRFFAPAAAIILMGSAPSRTGTPLTAILARMAATTLAITTMPLAAFLTLMASIEILEMFPTGSDIPTGTRIQLGEMLGTHGRAIYGSTTFAALTALLFHRNQLQGMDNQPTPGVDHPGEHPHRPGNGMVPVPELDPGSGPCAPLPLLDRGRRGILVDEKHPKPIPRWDVHFDILKTTEETQRLVILPLVANRVGTDSAVLRYVHFTLALV